MRPVRARRRLLSVFGSVLIVAGLLPVAAVASTSGVVISEFRFRGPLGGNDEFVELVNAGLTVVDISGWRLQGCSGTTGAPSQRATVPAGVSLSPGQHYLFTNSATSGGPYSGTVPGDTTYGTGFTDGAGARITLADQTTVVDGVGGDGIGGTQCREGAGIPGMPTVNGDQSYERIGGTQDTDNNATDFAGPKAGNPQNFGPTGGDAAPTVTDTDPDSNAIDVPRTANVSVTFSEPVTTTAAAFSISCDVSGAHTFAFSGGPSTYTLDPAIDFAQADTCTVVVDNVGVADTDGDDPPDNMAVDYTFSFSADAASRRIYEIQGAAHISPYRGQLVSAVPGVITAVRPNSFYMQDATGDGNVATSDAILVFATGIGAGFAPGQAVLVSGRVTEFRPGGAASANLTTTEITTPAVTLVGPGAAIAQTVIGLGGRRPPTTVIEDDAGGDVETGGVFDPARDGIDFYESLEAMLLRVNNPVVVGPRNDFGEVFVLADNGSGAGTRTNRRGIIIRKLGSAPYPNDYVRGDFNPERIQLEDDIVVGATPAVNVGDRFTSAAVGVLDYNFGNFEVQLTSALTRVDRGLQREVTRRPRSDELTVASFNVENLDTTDSAAKFAALAALIVNNMRAPDLIAIEEIQDNDGRTSAAPTDASATWAQLIAAIQAAGGPTYDYRQIDPLSNQDGGEPNGNIRVGFLFRTDRGLSFVDRPGGTAVNATHENAAQPGAQLTLSPGRVDPTNTAFANSRKPLAGEFTWRGKTFFAVANHFNSKGGDHPLFGRFQPPLRSSEAQRHQQAAIVNAFVDELLAADKRAKVIVLGDINDFEFSTTTKILKGGVLTTLIETLPRAERYTYVFEGNSQVLDQILVSKGLKGAFRGYDSIHVNAEFHDQASDHDPQLARFRF
jgi:predicted extracellular nuclease